jgi:hypothetical protein
LTNHECFHNQNRVSYAIWVLILFPFIFSFNMLQYSYKHSNKQTFRRTSKLFEYVTNVNIFK